MAWQNSYRFLLEIFPQVDNRLLKAAALDHKDDLTSAADFILNEVLETDTKDATQVPSSQALMGGLLCEKPSNNIGYDKFTFGSEVQFIVTHSSSISGLNDGLVSKAGEGSDVSTVNRLHISGNGSNFQDLGVGTPQVECRTLVFEQDKVSGPVVMEKSVDPCMKNQIRELVETSGDGEYGCWPPKNARLSAEEKVLIFDEARLDPSCLGLSEPVDSGMEYMEVSTQALSQMRRSGNGFERSLAVSTSIDPDSVEVFTSTSENVENLGKGTQICSGYCSESTSGSKGEAEIPVREDSLNGKTAYFIDEKVEEGNCWEAASGPPVPVVRIETLLDAVEQAKKDKEVLISAIEELRTLRQLTDEAEAAARVAKEEAEKDGSSLMDQVEEMRLTLSRAREANEVYSAEVHGERAVLATEARELQSRLLQLRREKEKALSILNEIKGTLQARLRRADEERESAVARKVAKEAFARECLHEEQKSMTRIAEESRELQAEREKCNMLQEFLIERGNAVDALQGEVAVLYEDAEELKEEMERMSLSYSSSFVHMLKPRPLTESTPNLRSSSRELVCESGGFLPHSLQQIELSTEDDVMASPVRSGSGSQRDDKRLPSLRQALSGSQDLSCSSHSSVSLTVDSNLGLSSKSETKSSSARASAAASQSGSEDERKVYEAKIFMFSDEKLLSFRNGNQDMFRAGSTKMHDELTGASTDEDDWQVLDVTAAAASKSTSPASSLSSTTGM